MKDKSIKNSLQFSFIMPAFNAEKYLVDSINELQKETKIKWELIIIDDFSTDKTFELAKSFSIKDKRIRVFKNIKKGKVLGTNYGYSLSRGEIIKCIDADDVLSVDYFKYYKIFSKYSAHCHDAFITNSELKTLAKFHINPLMISRDYKYVASKLLSFPKWTWSFNRKIANKIFPMPKTLPFEDVWINLIIKKNCRSIYTIEKPVYKYRQHSKQTFGGILTFNESAVIFRAKRVLKLINILRTEPRIINRLEKNVFTKIEEFYKLMSRKNLSFIDILRSRQGFNIKLKIILQKKTPFLAKYALSLKWNLHELFKS